MEAGVAKKRPPPPVKPKPRVVESCSINPSAISGETDGINGAVPGSKVSRPSPGAVPRPAPPPIPEKPTQMSSSPHALARSQSDVVKRSPVLPRPGQMPAAGSKPVPFLPRRDRSETTPELPPPPRPAPPPIPEKSTQMSSSPHALARSQSDVVKRSPVLPRPGQMPAAGSKPVPFLPRRDRSETTPELPPPPRPAPPPARPAPPPARPAPPPARPPAPRHWQQQTSPMSTRQAHSNSHTSSPPPHASPTQGIPRRTSRASSLKSDDSHSPQCRSVEMNTRLANTMQTPPLPTKAGSFQKKPHPSIPTAVPMASSDRSNGCKHTSITSTAGTVPSPSVKQKTQVHQLYSSKPDAGQQQQPDRMFGRGSPPPLPKARKHGSNDTANVPVSTNQRPNPGTDLHQPALSKQVQFEAQLQATSEEPGYEQVASKAQPLKETQPAELTEDNYEPVKPMSPQESQDEEEEQDGDYEAVVPHGQQSEDEEDPEDYMHMAGLSITTAAPLQKQCSLTHLPPSASPPPLPPRNTRNTVHFSPLPSVPSQPVLLPPPPSEQEDLELEEEDENSEDGEYMDMRQPEDYSEHTPSSITMSRSESGLLPPSNQPKHPVRTQLSEPLLQPENDLYELVDIMRPVPPPRRKRKNKAGKQTSLPNSASSDSLSSPSKNTRNQPSLNNNNSSGYVVLQRAAS